MKKRKKSFTLIEVLIVSVIIVILTSVSVVFFKPNREEVNLILSAHQLAQDIRYTEDLSLSGKKLPSGLPSGYGIHLEQGSDSYLIFADMDGDNAYEEINDEVIRGPVSLGKNIEILKLKPATPLDIVAVPPNPDIYINDNPNSNGTIQLSLESNPAKRITIIVNYRGLIEINE